MSPDMQAIMQFAHDAVVYVHTIYLPTMVNTLRRFKWPQCAYKWKTRAIRPTQLFVFVFHFFIINIRIIKDSINPYKTTLKLFKKIANIRMNIKLRVLDMNEYDYFEWIRSRRNIRIVSKPGFHYHNEEYILQKGDEN